MSFKTNMLLDKEFALAHGNQNSGGDYVKEFPFRVPRNRRNQKAKKPYWDLSWDSALSQSIRELKAEHININGGAFFRFQDIADAVSRRAEELWIERRS